MQKRSMVRFLIIAFISVFVLHQLYSSVYKPISTKSAEYSEVVDGLDITGFIIREESIIENSQSGALHFVVEDGSRVSKGGVIANIYDSAETSLTVNRIEQLEKQIKDIEDIEGYNDTQAADLSLVNGKVDLALSSFVLDCASGNFDNSADNAAELLTAINRRQMLTGEQTDFSSKLNKYREELSSLEASLPSSFKTIKSDKSGYFVSSADGYENAFKDVEIEDITTELLSSVKAQQVPENAIGKMVSDYEWYIAARVSMNDSLKYKIGDSLIVRTAIKSCPEMEVEVKAINISSAGDDAVMVFSCNQMNSELATMRTSAMTVVRHVYKGLKLPRKSLRVVEGKTGVYVVSGIVLKFVPVEVLFSTDEYIVCQQQKSNDNVLRLYDEVVIKGKRLYDGKIVG